MGRSPRARKGFTLIELLIVVAILVMLAAIAFPNFLEAQTRAKVARTRADIRSQVVALEAYRVDNNRYPLHGTLNQPGIVQNPQVVGPGIPMHRFLYEGITTPIAYLTSIPPDPFAPIAAPFAAAEPFQPRYFYANMDYYAFLLRRDTGAVPPVTVQKLRDWGTWILAAAGPDRDRLDLARDAVYDPTNGTVSDGDVIVSHLRPQGGR